MVPVKIYGSRFQDSFNYRSTKDLRLKVKTQFLSPNVTYIINLVYKRDHPHQDDLRIPFKYKLEGMRKYATSCVSRVGEGGWRRTELLQFTSTKNEHHFDIQFSGEMKGRDYFHEESFVISIEGVEFCPVHFENDENKVNMQPTSIDKGERLSFDYTKIVKWSKEMLTPKEAYFVFRKGL
ncbi:hypothetical protein HanLR1_Chr16g0607761 [Helianthus annuus]|nr:hypothetical protein HanLR1_Chr16g0607761 [Helianthus annuus]